MPSVAKLPNERWATDLCRVWSGRDGWTNLALVMDRCSRELLGWHLSRGGRSKTAEAALEQALIARFGTLGRVPKPFLLRSDNGLVFTSHSYTKLVRGYGLRQEFITPHTPEQNGTVERLIRTLKEQCVHRHRFETLQDASRVIGDWVGFYNARRAHAAVLNLANVSREAQVSRKTIEGYLAMLEDLLLALRVDVFTKRAKRELATHPKFYFFDTGIFRANRPAGPLDAASELDGAALEGLVAQHLHAWCAYSKGKHTLHYWQTRSRSEVDFVIYGESGLYAIEVKNSKRVDSSDLTALRNFAEDYPQSPRYILYRGDDRLKRDGILSMPCEEFLSALRPDDFPG